MPLYMGHIVKNYVYLKLHLLFPCNGISTVTCFAEFAYKILSVFHLHCNSSYSDHIRFHFVQ